MADFNPNTPSVRGQEWQPLTARTIRLDSPLKGVAQVFKASATTAVTNMHPYVSEIVGQTPGLSLEILDASKWVPTVSTATYFYGTNGGLTSTGWEDQGNNTAAANIVGAVDDWVLSGYIRNASALAATGTLDLKGRSSQTAFTSATRVVKLEIWAMVLLSTSTSNAPQVNLRGLLNIGSTDYVSDSSISVPRNGRWSLVTVAEYPLNPATDVPWTVSDVNSLWDATTDEWGLRLQGKVVAEGFRIGGLALVPYYCSENRVFSYYQSGSLNVGVDDGWLEQANTTNRALVSGAYYVAHLGALTGSAQNYLATKLLRDPSATWAADPTKTGEHRLALVTQLSSQGGVVVSATQQPLEMFPLLVDNGAIVDQSQPFADLVYREAAEKIGGVDLTGATNSYVTCTDSPGLSVTGDLELQALVALDDWTPSAAQTVVAKWTAAGNLRAYKLEVATDSSLSLWNSTNGTSTGSNYTSSASLTSVGVTNGQACWVGVSLDVQVSTNQRTATFYVSTNADPNANSAWQTLGTAKTSIGYTAIADTAAPLELGAEEGGTVQRLAGNLYRGRVISGLDRSDVRADVYLYADDASDQSLAARISDTTIGDSYGNSYTVNASFDRYRFAQAITTAAATSYVGVRFPVLWEGALAPDGPLTVEVQSGTEGATGKGTTVATGYLFPKDAPSPGGQRVDVLFSGGAWSASATTQYWLVFSSTAKRGQGWRVPVCDTRSDNIATGTTLVEVEGTSQNGATDAFASETGIVSNRYDLPVALIAAVSGASGLSASLLSAA